MCPNPEMPYNGDMKCSLAPSVSNDLLDPASEDLKSLLYAVDTECQFTCRPGYLLIGSRRRICLPLARWDGLRTVCKRKSSDLFVTHHFPALLKWRTIISF